MTNLRQISRVGELGSLLCATLLLLIFSVSFTQAQIVLVDDVYRVHSAQDVTINTSYDTQNRSVIVTVNCPAQKAELRTMSGNLIASTEEPNSTFPLEPGIYKVIVFTKLGRFSAAILVP